ncbi:MAG: sensor histidine kinase [Tractidigestivibacter sp.]|jgi:signal transduction histidine kinase|uniref:sensor histidine kinase n=1 Tax=Tractidigestivibacter sp. TaxID=2847320 RepID=UPI003D9175B6
MLKKLRREFVIITMTLVGLVLILTLGSSLIINYTTQAEVVEDALHRGLSNSVDAPPQFDRDVESVSPNLVTYVVDVNADGTIVSRSSYYIDEDVFAEILEEALESDSTLGKNNELHFEWMKVATEDGWRIAIADTSTIDANLAKMTLMDAGAVLIALGALFVIVWLLSAWILKPIKENWDSQKRFISDASHELKTPLAVIIANTDILNTDDSLNEEQHRWVSSTLDEAHHMQGLVEDLLTLARTDEAIADRNSSALNKVDIDFSELVDGSVLEFDAIAFERGCQIEKDIDEDVHVQGDYDQLSRAVNTLIDNATKYAPKGSVVKVALKKPELSHSSAKLTVNNGGDPIAAEELAHLFDRFYRSDKARERQKSGGFGLGLAICKGIIEAHGGTITATSTAQDGTTFTVVL